MSTSSSPSLTGKSQILQWSRRPVVTVTDAAGPFMLTSVDVAAFNGAATSNILIDGYDALGDVIASETVTVNDNALPFITVSTAGTAFAGLELAEADVHRTSTPIRAGRRG